MEDGLAACKSPLECSLSLKGVKRVTAPACGELGGEALITDVMHTSYSFFVPLSIIQYRDRVSEYAWGNASMQNRKCPLQIVPGRFNASKICITEGPIQVSVAHFVIP